MKSLNSYSFESDLNLKPPSWLFQYGFSPKHYSWGTASITDSTLGWRCLLQWEQGCFFSLCPTWHLSLTDTATWRSQLFCLTIRKVDWKQIDLFTTGHSPLSLSLDQAQNRVTDVLLQQRFCCWGLPSLGEKFYSPRIASVISTVTSLETA